MNDPIFHARHCLATLSKLASDIPKFEGKPREYPSNHVMAYHLWCSSNSLMDDSIRLHLFLCTLTRLVAKWYIELPLHFFNDFNSLSMAFSTHFQLLIYCATGTELLTSLWKSTSIDISYHIHEWRRWQWLIKVHIPYHILVDWFRKSIFPPIAWDVSMGVVITEE